MAELVADVAVELVAGFAVELVAENFDTDARVRLAIAFAFGLGSLGSLAAASEFLIFHCAFPSNNPLHHCLQNGLAPIFDFTTPSTTPAGSALCLHSTTPLARGRVPLPHLLQTTDVLRDGSGVEAWGRDPR